MGIHEVEAALARLGFSEWLSLASAIVAIVSFLLSRATVRRQELMQYEALRAQRDDQLVGWADAAIRAIADAQRHCRDLKNGLLTPEETKRNASELRTRMSALLDSGRLFFPNQQEADDDDMGAPAEAAYLGQSHDAIDALYNAYQIISHLGRDSPLTPEQAVKAVVAHRRRFVSEVFRSIDPRRREDAMSSLSVRRRAVRQQRS
jgi:hypothetical protein